MMLRVLDLTRVFLVCLTIGLPVVRCRNKEYMNPEWIDPHDWTVDKDPLKQLCPQTETCKPCTNTAKSEYLRLVNSLFNPNEFRFDESTNYLYRSVHIHITKEQLEKLRKLTDVIHIDGLVSEILAQTEFGTVQSVKEYTVDVASTVWNHMPEMPSLSEINFNALPRSRPILINFTIMILTYFVCRRYGINYLIFLFFALVYCLYEYLDNECHRKIELNEAVDFIYGKERNPCMSPMRMNWYDWVLGRDSRSACRDFLERQNAHKTQCGIVDLFHEFITSILLKQLVLFFTTIAELVRSISTTNGILITAVTLYFMKGLLVTIIQSVFKYILNPTIWSRVASDINTSTVHQIPDMQRVQTVTDSDIRDVNVSKALDLATQQMQLILEHKKIEMATIQPSGIEVLAVKAAEGDKSSDDITPSTSAEQTNESQYKYEIQSRTQATPSSDGSESYEEFVDDAEIVSTNISVVTVDDTQPFLITEISSENNATEDSANSPKFSGTFNNTSSLSNNTESSDDSVEILSISSDTPAL